MSKFKNYYLFFNIKILILMNLFILNIKKNKRVAIDLNSKMLEREPSERYSIALVLNHP